jgi:hypothetical protein
LGIARLLARYRQAAAGRVASSKQMRRGKTAGCILLAGKCHQWHPNIRSVLDARLARIASLKQGE